MRVAQLLLAAVQDGAWRGESGLGERVGDQPMPGLAERALFHRVTSYVHHAVGSSLPQPARGELERDHLSSLASHLRGLADLRTVAAALDPVTPWLVVKGPVLAELVHPKRDLRGYSDVDILVPAVGFGAAVAALESVGAQPTVNWAAELANESSEIQFELPSGGVVDLHWHLLNGTRLRGQFSWDMPGLFDCAVPVVLGGHAVMTPAPADSYLHLAAHACFSGGNRLGWLLDLHHSVLRGAVDTEELALRAREAGLGQAVALMTAKCAHLLGTPGASGIVRATGASPVWLAVSRLATAVAPVQNAGEGRSVARMVARATRATARASLRELTKRAADRRPGPIPAGSSPERAAAARSEFLDYVPRHGGR